MMGIEADTEPEDFSSLNPLHDQLRGLLFLRRSPVPKWDYPSIMKDLRGKCDYASIVEVLRTAYTPFRMLERTDQNRGSTSGRRKTHHQGHLADIAEDECSWDYNQDDHDGSAHVEPECETGYQAEEPETDDIADEHDDGFDYYTVPEEGMLDECGYWLTSSEKAVEQQDCDLCIGDPDYETAFIAYKDARTALRNARVAREFYPAVVPASAFSRKNQTSERQRQRKAQGQELQGW